ncbi:MAG: ATPase [Mycobacterium sp.]|jgi:signal transduction histidine kinase|nr:ATPase [Mycobacterium sp.]
MTLRDLRGRVTAIASLSPAAPADRSTAPRPGWIAAWVRFPLLLLVVGLTVSTDPSPQSWAWVAVLACAAVLALPAKESPRLARVGRVAEVVVAALAAARTGPAIGSTLPYLAAPVLAAGLVAGALDAFLLLGVAVALLGARGWATDMLEQPDFVRLSVTWVVVAAVVAMVAAWAGRWLRMARPTTSDPEPEYAQATRLLTQLRTVARQLPGTLDPGSIADRLLDEIRSVAPSDRAAVLTGSGGGRLMVLSQAGLSQAGLARVDWETTLDADTPVAEAWLSQQPQVAGRSLARTGRDGEVSALVLPLVTGVRTVGLVLLESDRAGAYPPAVVAAARSVADPAALRLETALLFDDVRSIATNEERQRLAREIHDGVAQELVMVGYGIDNALAQLPPGADGSERALRTLREEVTRVITELRLSLFELRSDVDRHGGLGTAIADYARTVGAAGGMRVHLSLDEAGARLPAAVEGELLRIAQEAVTNARKHSRAENLWVTCEVDPPFARVEVSDDGAGMPPRTRDGSYGMSIMAERATRVRATLAIAAREPNGTTVSVVLASRHGSGSVSVQEVEDD